LSLRPSERPSDYFERPGVLLETMRRMLQKVVRGAYRGSWNTNTGPENILEVVKVPVKAARGLIRKMPEECPIP
jgi:hypothetical protein